MKLLHLIFWSLIILYSSSCTYAYDDLGQEKDFILFESTAYKDRSSFFEHGFIAIEELGYFHFWDKDDDLNALPDKRKYCSVLRNIKKREYEWVIIDVEHWVLNARLEDQELVTDNLEKYVTIMNWAKECRPELKFGLYATVPIIDHHYVFEDESSAKFQYWKSQNLALKNLVDAVDALFPSLYAVYEETEKWDHLARKYISMARSLAGDKPVYPYIWPQYHPGSKKKGQFVSGEFWLHQLEEVYELADGAVVWGGWNFGSKSGPMDWDENEAWWEQTKDFVRAKNIK